MKPKIDFTHSFRYQEDEESPEKLFVSGFSIHEGIYQDNTVEIPQSELQNIGNSLVGAKLMKDHSRSVDDIVGRIQETKLDYDEGNKKNGVRYLGYTYDESLNKKIKQNLIDNVSIGFAFTPICSKCEKDFRECSHFFDEAHIVAKDCACYEQSFVMMGADKDTTVKPQGYFSNASEFLEIFPKEQTENSWQKFDYSYYSMPKEAMTFTLSQDTGESMKDDEKKGEALQEEIEQLSKKVTELSEQLAGKDSLIEELKDKMESQKEVIDAYVEQFDKIEAAKKEAFCKDLVSQEVEKGMTAKEEFDERVEKLMGMSQETLDAVSEIIESSPKIKGTPGQFDDAKESAFEEEQKFDPKDKGQVRSVLFSALKYQKE